MGLFSNFPYTNFHELNLDWLIRTVRKLETAFPEGVIGIIKGGTGANNAADARSNLEIRGDTIPMTVNSEDTINDIVSIVIGNLSDLNTAINTNIKYKIYKSVDSLGLTPGAVNLGAVWAAMSIGEILIAPPTDFSSGVAPEANGTLVMIRNGGTSGSIRFYGNSTYSMKFSNNYPDGTWNKIYTDADTVPISNGGTGATTAAEAIQNLGIDFSGEVLSVSGVGADETGNVPLTADNLDIEYKHFNSVADVGLPSGSTITAIWNAMPNYSIIDCHSSEIGNPPTGKTGIVQVVKLAGSGYITFHGITSADGVYTMYLANGTPTGTWVSDDTSAQVITREITVATQQSVSARQANTFTSQAEAIAGYTPLTVVNVYPSDGHALVRFARVDGNGVVRVSIYNFHTNAITVTVGATVIYLKN